MEDPRLIEYCEKVLTPKSQARVDKAIALAEEYVAKRDTLWRWLKNLFYSTLPELPERQIYIQGLLAELNFALKGHWVGCEVVANPLRPIEAFFDGVVYLRSAERPFFECTCHLKRGFSHVEFIAGMDEFLEDARVKARAQAAAEQQEK